MPYKHIAAHLNKTELACRLHYHQLSHGSNRRKRGTSCSPGSDNSPVLPVSAPSSAHGRLSRSISPARPYENAYAATTPPRDVQLPSIMGNDYSSRGPPILPKPVPMNYGSRANSPQTYPSGGHESRTPLPPAAASLRQGASPHPHPHHHHHHPPPPHPVTPSPRLEALSIPYPSAATHTPSHVDLNRLHAVYAAHRDRFWEAIASEYGYHATPTTLEKAWKTGRCCSPVMAPLASPKEEDKVAQSIAASRDKIRISSILS